MSDGADDFIEVYENALAPEVCAALIARFGTSDAVQRGATGGGVNTEVKNSWDILVTGNPQWKDAENALNSAMLSGLRRYLRKYPYTILGPLWLKMKDPKTGTMTMLDESTIAALDEPRLTALAVKAFRPGAINIQRYLADEGGYPRWHCELYPSVNDSTCENLHRTLLWTIYLNDDFADGETEFLHQRRKIIPRTGSLLIAPAAFTHTHRGNKPKRSDKYIATSWILFQRGEAVFAQK